MISGVPPRPALRLGSLPGGNSLSGGTSLFRLGPQCRRRSCRNQRVRPANRHSENVPAQCGHSLASLCDPAEPLGVRNPHLPSSQSHPLDADPLDKPGSQDHHPQDTEKMILLKRYSAMVQHIRVEKYGLIRIFPRYTGEHVRIVRRARRRCAVMHRSAVCWRKDSWQ